MKNLKAIREMRKVTQVKLSIEVGVSQEVISAYESGKAMPSVDILCKIAAFFNVSTDYLLDRTSIPNAVKDICLDGLNSGETELITLFRQLDKNNKSKAIGVLLGLKE